jgi:hypothetical protein
VKFFSSVPRKIKDGGYLDGDWGHLVFPDDKLLLDVSVEAKNYRFLENIHNFQIFCVDQNFHKS